MPGQLAEVKIVWFQTVPFRCAEGENDEEEGAGLAEGSRENGMAEHVWDGLIEDPAAAEDLFVFVDLLDDSS